MAYKLLTKRKKTKMLATSFSYLCFMSYLSTNKRHFINSLFIGGIFLFVLVLVFVMEYVLEMKFDFLGVLPRSLFYLHGIVTHVLVHADLSHLLNNGISIFILTVSLFYFYGKIADMVLLLSWICTGVLLWSIGRENLHIGASGLIYAQAFFLFWSGVMRKYAPLVAIAFIVVFLYGNMIWHVFPWQAFPNESWEGHLSGAVIGSTLAFLYRKEGPQQPIKEWKEDEETEGEKEFAAYAESFEVEGEEPTMKIEE